MKGIGHASDSPVITGIEFEIAQEQAESLGLAGKKLQESIDRFNAIDAAGSESAGGAEALQEVASRAWALMVQRELIGFTHDNLRWLRDRFDLPAAALRLLGPQQ